VLPRVIQTTKCRNIAMKSFEVGREYNRKIPCHHQDFGEGGLGFCCSTLGHYLVIIFFFFFTQSLYPTFGGGSEDVRQD